MKFTHCVCRAMAFFGRKSPSSPGGKSATTTSDPGSPGIANVDAQVDELQALVAQSREEQAVISSKILALKSGGGGGAAGRAAGFGAPGAAGGEVMALREQLAEADSLLLEKDAQVENLHSQVKALMVHVEEPRTGAAWRQRYEGAQKALEAMRKDYQGVKVELIQRQQETVNLTSYLRILETDQSLNEKQRERLLKDTHSAAEKVRIFQGERDSLSQQLRTLEEGFLRCTGRVTHSLAAGVATVIVNDKSPEARFLVLRTGTDGAGVMEIFLEPDAHDELLSIDLSTAAAASASADTESMTILLKGGNGESELRICCVSMEELMKWSGALRLVGFDDLTTSNPKKKPGPPPRR